MKVNKLIDWCELPTGYGVFRMYDTGDDTVRLISSCDIHDCNLIPIVRIQSSCMASEIFKALDCDCADQLNESMELIYKNKNGFIIHLQQEGRGHGLSMKIKAISLMQKEGLDTVQAFDKLKLSQDIRDYSKATEIIKLLGFDRIKLITNNPRKIHFIQSNGIEVVEQICTNPIIRRENKNYLYSKNKKLSHKLPLPESN